MLGELTGFFFSWQYMAYGAYETYWSYNTAHYSLDQHFYRGDLPHPALETPCRLKVKNLYILNIL